MSRKCFYLVFLFVLLLGLVSNAQAAINWTDSDPGDHLWGTADNWDPNRLPVSTESVTIGGTTLCEVDASMVGATKAVGNALYGPGYTSGTATLNVNGGELDINTNFFVGHSAGTTGIVNVTNGGSVDSGSFRLGASSSNGTLYMNGGTVNASTDFQIGRSNGSTGLATIDSGNINSSGIMTIGVLGSSSGTFTMNSGAGTVDVTNYLYIGDGGAGTVNLNGGTLTSNNYVQIGKGAGVGAVNIDGGTLSATGAGHMYVGNGSNSSLTLDSGTVSTTTSDFYIGSASSGTGTVSISGGNINVGGALRLGCSGGDGTLYMNGGTVDASADLQIGRSNGSTGLATIDSGSINSSGIMTLGVLGGSSGTLTMNSGAGTITVTDRLHIGDGGAGTVNLNGGTLTSNNYLQIGKGAGVGTVNVNGGTLSATGANHMYVGIGSNSSLTLDSGTVSTTTSHLYIGHSVNSTSTVSANGGSMSIGGTIRIGNEGGTGTLNINTDVTAGQMFLGVHNGSTAELNMTGGSLDVTGKLSMGTYGSATALLRMTAGSITSGGNLYVGENAAGMCDVELLGGTISALDLFINSLSSLDIEAGTLILAGDDRATVNGYIDSGLLTGYGSLRNVVVSYDGSDTTVTADADLVNYAWNPSPADGAVDVYPNVVLSWSPGDSAAKHQIYFGDDFDEVNDATTSTPGIYKGEQNLGDEEFDPGALECGLTYYWRIDEVNGSVWTGNVWSFTMVNPPVGDINRDCIVNFKDFAILANDWLTESFD